MLHWNGRDDGGHRGTVGSRGGKGEPVSPICTGERQGKGVGEMKTSGDDGSKKARSDVQNLVLLYTWNRPAASKLLL